MTTNFDLRIQFTKIDLLNIQIIYHMLAIIISLEDSQSVLNCIKKAKIIQS